MVVYWLMVGRLPDNGNSQDPAGNILRNNGKADLHA